MNINELQSGFEIDTYKVKIKTIKKEFLDQNTELQLELVDENKQSDKIILSQMKDDDEPFEKNTIRAFTIKSKKDLGKVLIISYF